MSAKKAKGLRVICKNCGAKYAPEPLTQLFVLPVPAASVGAHSVMCCRHTTAEQNPSPGFAMIAYAKG